MHPSVLLSGSQSGFYFRLGISAKLCDNFPFKKFAAVNAWINKKLINKCVNKIHTYIRMVVNVRFFIENGREKYLFSPATSARSDILDAIACEKSERSEKFNTWVFKVAPSGAGNVRSWKFTLRVRSREGILRDTHVERDVGTFIAIMIYDAPRIYPINEIFTV